MRDVHPASEASRIAPGQADACPSRQSRCDDASVDVCRWDARLNDRMCFGRAHALELSDSSKGRNRSGQLFRRQGKCNVDASSSQEKQPLDTSFNRVVCECVRSRTYVGATLQRKIHVVIEVPSFRQRILDKRGTLNASQKYGGSDFV